MDSLGGGTGYLKAGLLGFQGSGKTFTAMLLARATQERMGLKGKIAMFDTEAGSPFIAPHVKTLTGHDLVGKRSRSFRDMMDFAEECEKDDTIDVSILDSMTHPWRELMAAFLDRTNRQRKRHNKPPLDRLPFQKWGPLKDMWAKFTDWYLNSKMHIIICGRAGYDYDYVENDETNKLELRKTGVKMKTETEFAYEASLLVEMSRVAVSSETALFTRNALVIKDRFGILDGKEFAFTSNADPKVALKAVAESFGPHLDLLVPGAHAPVDTAVRSEPEVDDEGNDTARQYAIKRDILLEEISGELTMGWSSRGKDRIAILEQVFATTSKMKMEKFRIEELVDGLDKIRVLREEKKLAEAEETKEPVKKKPAKKKGA
jgi:hypothetical protein